MTLCTCSVHQVCKLLRLQVLRSLMKSLERVLTRCSVFGFHIYTSCAAHMTTILALPALVTWLTAYAQIYHWQAPGLGFRIYDTADKLPGFKCWTIPWFCYKVYFGFLKIFRIKRSSILGLYFFEFFWNQRKNPLFWVFFFSLIHTQKNLWLQVFEKKNSKNQECYEIGTSSSG